MPMEPGFKAAAIPAVTVPPLERGVEASARPPGVRGVVGGPLGDTIAAEADYDRGLDELVGVAMLLVAVVFDLIATLLESPLLS